MNAERNDWWRVLFSRVAVRMSCDRGWETTLETGPWCRWEVFCCDTTLGMQSVLNNC